MKSCYAWLFYGSFKTCWKVWCWWQDFHIGEREPIPVPERWTNPERAKKEILPNLGGEEKTQWSWNMGVESLQDALTLEGSLKMTNGELASVSQVWSLYCGWKEIVPVPLSCMILGSLDRLYLVVYTWWARLSQWLKPQNNVRQKLKGFN